MIVVCPSCFCKYSVQADSIGQEKLVRCAMCGATWRQSTLDGSTEKKQHAQDLIKWTFFWFMVFVTIFSLFFAKNAVMKIWPSISSFYEMAGLQNEYGGKAFVIQNLSNFFVIKNDALYMGLKGELLNVSNEVQSIPSIIISLKDDENVKKDSHYKKIWNHNPTYKKLLPNQKVVFETELQSVPYNNLICDIKLDVL
ncbi:MAG: zinc-ribbon domain-containing protein [Holosporaceae bacterium]|jgi:predicted Zn finger-like uncharacterized protein|nr:zinc-ribbon domain-containing protein [Holosporaceae bacterium]